MTITNILNKTFIHGVEFMTFLQETADPYTRFIIEKKQTEHVRLDDQLYEKHHIKPEHSGGTNDEWNLITLSYEDHTKAHCLLAECYNSKYDLAVCKMRQNQTSEARQAMREANVEKMRNNKTGWFSSELQRELANRPKKPRKTYARSLYVSAALERGTIWEHEDGATLLISPDQCDSATQVAAVLSERCDPAMKKAFEEKQHKSYLVNGVTKLLQGYFIPQSNRTHMNVGGRRLYKVGPWTLKGIRI